MRTIKTSVLIFLLAIQPLFLLGLDYPKRIPNTLIHDYIDWIDDGDERQLDAKLIDFDNRSGNQITIVIVDDLQGYDPNDYATRLGEEWGVGGAEFSNGVLILIKPTGGQGQKRTAIAVGYGLEAVIPDITALSIINNELLPNFKQGLNFEGLDQATDVIISLAEQEFTAEEYGSSQGGGGGGIFVILLFLLIFFGIPMLRARQYSKVNDVSFWTALWLLNRSTGKGNWDDFSGGRGPFTGGGGGGFSGGGGFGGFGGGSFGGGGASGSW